MEIKFLLAAFAWKCYTEASKNLHKIEKEEIHMYGNLIDTIGFVAEADPEVGQAMNRELGRQRDSIELIASENIVSPAVIAAMGSVLTNKYAEGLPGKRYYGGCQWVVELENIPEIFSFYFIRR